MNDTERSALQMQYIDEYDRSIAEIDAFEDDPNNLDLGEQNTSPSFAKLATAAAVGAIVGVNVAES